MKEESCVSAVLLLPLWEEDRRSQKKETKEDVLLGLKRKACAEMASRANLQTPRALILANGEKAKALAALRQRVIKDVLNRWQTEQPTRREGGVFS